MAEIINIRTSRGLARAYLSLPAQPLATAAVVLGHGAGGGIGARDLQVAQDVALELGAASALVEQPYRVAGRRSPPPAVHLDEVWVAAVEALRARLSVTRIVCGGRSSGARVACRTAGMTRATGVLCLAFPLQPPQRRVSHDAPPSRLPELDAVAAAVLVVQGDRDGFGMPPAAPGRTVAVVAGDHALRQDLPAVRAAITDWLAPLICG